MIMKTRIQLPHLMHIVSAKTYNIFWKTFASNIGICFSNFHHQFTMRFFNNQKRKNFWQNVIQKRARCIPEVNGTLKGSFRCISGSHFFVTSKEVIQPINQNNIAGSNRMFAMPLRSISIFSLLGKAKIKAAFAIGYASQIRKLAACLISSKFYNSSHKNLINNHSLINEWSLNVHRERLSEKALFRDATV